LEYKLKCHVYAVKKKLKPKGAQKKKKGSGNEECSSGGEKSTFLD